MGGGGLPTDAEAILLIDVEALNRVRMRKPTG